MVAATTTTTTQIGIGQMFSHRRHHRFVRLAINVHQILKQFQCLLQKRPLSIPNRSFVLFQHGNSKFQMPEAYGKPIGHGGQPPDPFFLFLCRNGRNVVELQVLQCAFALVVVVVVAQQIGGMVLGTIRFQKMQEGTGIGFHDLGRKNRLFELLLLWIALVPLGTSSSTSIAIAAIASIAIQSKGRWMKKFAGNFFGCQHFDALNQSLFFQTKRQLWNIRH